MGNSWGQLFRVTTWGESHGAAIGAVVDGCPPRLPLSEADIQPDLDRRVPGQSALVTQRKETDTVQILSGVFEGQTLGTPISMLIPNEDMRPGDYREVKEKYRPSHADYTYEAKYGIRDWRGGGRTSARETAGRVAAGAIARKLLSERFRVTVVAWVSKVGTLERGLRSRARHARRGRSHADPLPRSRDGRAHDRGRRGGAQGRRLARRHRHVRRARLPARLGRAGLRSPRGRSGQGDDEPAGQQGLRDRLGLRRHRAARLAAQRRVLHGWRPRAHPHQPLRRRAGRHHQRRDDLLPRGLQADGDDHARAAHRQRRPRGHHASPAAAATTRACCRARCRWWKR